MRARHSATYEIERVEHLYLARYRTAWIGQEGVFTIRRERAEAFAVGRYVANGVQNLHVAHVMDVDTLFQANDQPLEEGDEDVRRAVRRKHVYHSIEFDGENGVGERVRTYLRSFLEMAHFQLARRLVAHQRRE